MSGVCIVGFFSFGCKIRLDDRYSPSLGLVFIFVFIFVLIPIPVPVVIVVVGAVGVCIGEADIAKGAFDPDLGLSIAGFAAIVLVEMRAVAGFVFFLFLDT